MWGEARQARARGLRTRYAESSAVNVTVDFPYPTSHYTSCAVSSDATSIAFSAVRLHILHSWLTQSGVPLGEMTAAYMSLLTQDALPGDSPFFVPTSRLGVFTAVAPGSVSKLSFVVKQLLTEFYPNISATSLKEYSFHSLRRGGATWARSRGVPLGLIIALGLWTTVDGARSYLVPSEEEKTLASFLM